MELLDNLEPLQRAFWYIALPATLIFIIQTIMTFMGGVDSSDGIEADFSGNLDSVEAPFQLFSLRNLINFLLGFGWGGISLYHSIDNKAALIFVAVLIGVAFVSLFFIIIKQLMKLSENNSFNIKNTLNKTAEVYLTIPAKKQGKGKVLISVNGAVHQLDAITENDRIESGSFVKVVNLESGNLLIVENI